ncbi:MAG: histidine kinase [Bryobacteraceae bacterium]|nr:histidine kinase [Bryobacteraceae bacterium]
MTPSPSNHGARGRAIRSLPEGGSDQWRQRPSRFGSWPLLIVAFGILVALMLASGVAIVGKATLLYSTLSKLNREYREHWRSVEEIQSGIHISSVLIRDYLLDPSQARAQEIREELLTLRTHTEAHLKSVAALRPDESGAKVAQLRAEIDAYWETLDPVFDWSVEDKRVSAYGFLRHRIMPRREAALALAQEVQDLTDVSFRQQREEIRRNEEEFRSFVWRTVAAIVCLGVLVALVSIVRVWQLEKRSHAERLLTERAEDEMRRLSHQLVHAQEEERRSISRELHDEVGQMLTGLRMDLRSLQKVHRTEPAAFDERVEQTRVLLEQTLQAVRDIAMGLRPSMLDDLGLEAALQWQVRDFERRHEIAVTLIVEAPLENLPERCSTNLYRIVQEALTNCARHSMARAATIRIYQDRRGALQLRIEDDGVGMREKSGGGIGLIGIQERVRELGGAFRVESLEGKGTALAVELPEEAVAHG